MVLSCCVKGCKRDSYKVSGVSFHKFPKDEVIKNRWLDVVPGNFTQYSAVFSLHFKAEDFATHPAASRKMLKVNTIPSIFPMIIPENKKVDMLSSITISEEKSLNPQKSSCEPESPFKKIKLQQNAGTQTSVFLNKPRKTKLQRQIKILSQKLKRHNETINTLKSLLSFKKV
ncbi:hypothetical protein K1T71_014306 [Dendrolimus kikuchii]|uniref:Uncharacterized protein n=1 Tax=Dendrolimus kikuchii TaxID=765133 RepID=A0ACC1CFM0_9NEOP|nr:hypothetical protein K1T71_014306 [Dendrolimus kikuchii]